MVRVVSKGAVKVIKEIAYNPYDRGFLAGLGHVKPVVANLEAQLREQTHLAASRQKQIELMQGILSARQKPVHLTRLNGH